MKSVIFIIKDNCTGGFVSSLSSLFDAIKSDFDIQILQLTSMGDACNSYHERTIAPCWLCDCYYSDYTLTSGWKKLFVGLVHLLAKIDKKLEQKIANHYQHLISQTDCVIAFSEGAATSLCQYFHHPKKIAWIHHDITHYPRSNADEVLFGKYDRIVCVAETISERLKVMYPSLKQKVLGIHNIIEEDRILNLSKEGIGEIMHNEINIVSVGRIAPVKRFDMIPLIAKNLVDMGLDFKWWIIGPASDETIIYKIKESIVRYKVDDYVEWIGGKKNPYPYIEKAELLVSTSSTEACPMIFSEARVLNTPIVSADFLTANEFVEDGKDGIVSSVDNMATNIFRVLTDDEFRCFLIKNSMLRGSGNVESLSRIYNLINR